MEIFVFPPFTTPAGSDGGPLVAAANPANPRQKQFFCRRRYSRVRPPP